MNDKLKILDDAGFKESPDWRMWFSREQRKSFSQDFVDDHADDQLTACLKETVLPTEFWFYFRFVPDDDSMTGCSKFLTLLQLTNLTPIIHAGIRRAAQS
jgi:hypothetical protein